MWRIVVVVIYGNPNSKKQTDFRHWSSPLFFHYSKITKQNQRYHWIPPHFPPKNFSSLSRFPDPGFIVTRQRRFWFLVMPSGRPGRAPLRAAPTPSLSNRRQQRCSPFVARYGQTPADRASDLPTSVCEALRHRNRTLDFYRTCSALCTLPSALVFRHIKTALLWGEPFFASNRLIRR